ncbi:hypothetical protein T08_16128 [Trichinella sp. T8]|nr:hypothetical protein T08_16128 [Trichinella sp. T8]
MPKKGSFAFCMSFYNLHGTTACFASVVVYVDRTVCFNFSNLMQMWRHTLNQGAFHRKLTCFGIRSTLHCEIGEFLK